MLLNKLPLSQPRLVQNKRSCRTNVRCNKDENNIAAGPSSQESTRRLGVGVGVASVASILLAKPGHATVDYPKEWAPRRHFRRLPREDWVATDTAESSEMTQAVVEVPITVSLQEQIRTQAVEILGRAQHSIQSAERAVVEVAQPVAASVRHQASGFLDGAVAGAKVGLSKAQTLQQQSFEGLGGLAHSAADGAKIGLSKAQLGLSKVQTLQQQSFEGLGGLAHSAADGAKVGLSKAQVLQQQSFEGLGGLAHSAADGTRIGFSKASSLGQQGFESVGGYAQRTARGMREGYRETVQSIALPEVSPERVRQIGWGVGWATLGMAGGALLVVLLSKVAEPKTRDASGVLGSRVGLGSNGTGVGKAMDSIAEGVLAAGTEDLLMERARIQRAVGANGNGAGLVSSEKPVQESIEQPVRESTERRVQEFAQKPVQESGPPRWWAEAPDVEVSEQLKQQALEIARDVVDEMEEQDIYNGREYPISSIISLRNVCAEAGIVIVPNTMAGRDGMFAAGARAALDAAAEQNGSKIDGDVPERFVSELAHVLGVPLERAIDVVESAVGDKSHVILVDSCLACREGDTEEVLFQLLGLAGLLDRFPLPQGSEHIERVAAAVEPSGTLDERQTVFFTFGVMEPSRAALVAEMLGFDPKQILPQLESKILPAAERVLQAW